MSDQETKTETEVVTGTIQGELVPGVTEEMVPYKDVDEIGRAHV